MLTDAVRFEDILDALGYDPARKTAAKAIIRFLEKRFGAEFVIRKELMPFGKEELLPLFEIVHTLQNAGIIEQCSRRVLLPDEPPVYTWTTKYRSGNGKFSGGSSADNDAGALVAALAEGLERYLWQEVTDYFLHPFTATPAEASKKSPIVELERFAGFTEAQRREVPALTMKPESQYLWVTGRSLAKNRTVCIPAQIISAKHSRASENKEPVIRKPITTGLATGPTSEFAILNGALEAIERDAHMITWLNQLTLPQFDPYTIAPDGSGLRILLERCERYRIKVSALRLITDAPAYVTCAVLEDERMMPPTTVGLKAHRDPTVALEGAMLEALRARMTVRTGPEKAERARNLKSEEVRLEDRTAYWSDPKRALHLSFLTAGPIVPLETDVPWKEDSSDMHLERIVRWARESSYEFITVDIGRSSKNPLPWKVYMVVIPELQPMHLNEKYQYLGGERLKKIPEQFGYVARPTPFTKEPQPLA